MPLWQWLEVLGDVRRNPDIWPDQAVVRLATELSTTPLARSLPSLACYAGFSLGPMPCWESTLTLPDYIVAVASHAQFLEPIVSASVSPRYLVALNSTPDEVAPRPIRTHRSPTATLWQVGLACAGREEPPIGYMRQALADSVYRDQPVFKGGTTLFKIYGLIV
jgi:hypothetical protein